jgi:hypothetical protein
MNELKRREKIKELLGNDYWRMNHLYTIEPKQGGLIKFRFNYVQKCFWRTMWWLNVVLKSRQHGLSTLINQHQLDTCLFNKNVTCGIIDNTMPDAAKKLNKIKLSYENLDNPDVHPDTCKLGATIKEGVRIVKSNESEIEFSNGSKIWVGVSLRGGTVQYLHVSELGPIAYNHPERAKEIRSGAFNTVHIGCKITIESTHEGGKTGLNYDMVRLAQGSPKDLSPMHWRFHFFAWWEDPDNVNVIDSGYDYAVTPEIEEIFSLKSEELGVKFTPEQKYWYAMRKANQKEDMATQHPFDREEALNISIRGAIYGKELAGLRHERRVLDFKPDANAPLFTFWDLGSTDYTWILLMQFYGMNWYLQDCFAWHGKGARFYYAKIVEFERKYGPITMNFMPHDSKQNHKGEGSSWIDDFKACGMNNIKPVPRTPDIWHGIKHLRTQLPRFYIHNKNCDQEFKTEEIRIPSLVSCLEGYHTEMDEKNGILKEVPRHDEFSHGADALRTFAEAHKKGMLDDPASFTGSGMRSRNVVDRGRFGGSGFQGVSHGSGGSNVVRY